MLVFFTMGFIDLIGIATNYVKSDFALSDTAANSFSIMVYLWFLVFSIPTGMLMNRIGRRRTVLLSLVVTLTGLCIPFLVYTRVSMLVCFSLLGLGNTLMQVSLNPLLSNIVRAERLASYLTLGQFVKAIASFIAPIIAAQALIHSGDWKLLFPVFAFVAAGAFVYLVMTPIREHTVDGEPSSFLACFAMLGDKVILLLFLGILVHVGIDVGVNITAPKLLIERAGITLAQAGYATSLYFLFRTVGCLVGTFALARFSAGTFFGVSVGLMLLGIFGLYISFDAVMVYGCVALIGLGNANVFPIIFSRALGYLPARSNEISGLMVMGIAGGGVFPLLMGVAADTLGGQVGAVVVLTCCIAYLCFLLTRFNVSYNN